ncbi:hypothetical protein SAMN04487898_11243 [Pedobacter sp. ok626]|uniref:hypothetical protein n=1 Tax=Pedobacter sp. ok626 TaxID=1761882 RepID=UPI00088A57AC|nr:hypothetical protein [Pedobacter sp. ok626]SDK81240.1 hypothetical protein SAMN04487898_11243 [Pedobacter sp. ok626]
MLKFLKPVVLVAFLASAAFTGCKQQEIVVEKIDETPNVDILTLRKYFANRINVEVDDLKYDEKTQQFSLRGVDQVSLEKLTRFYLNSQAK